ncbi:MAG: hypothetical protein LBM04_06605, partial [Opitutaceae bacterium]|nr:hypothetical protein [Opitutaceae bacterium]
MRFNNRTKIIVAGIAGMLLGALVTIPICIYKASVMTTDTGLHSSRGQLIGAMATLYMLDENNFDRIKSYQSQMVMAHFIYLARHHQAGFSGAKGFERYLVETARYIKSHPKDFIEKEYFLLKGESGAGNQSMKNI